MKKIKSFFVLALLGSFLFIGCSKDDNPILDDGTTMLPCDVSPKDLLVLNTLFDGAANAQINYNSFAINGLDSSLPNSQGSFTTTTNMTYELPTGASIYSETNGVHGIMITRAGKYFTFNTTTGVGQEYTVPTSVSAPIELNNSAYVIEVANSGYPNQGIGNHYDIKPFNINNGNISAALPIDPLDKTFDNHSFFHVESVSATTNGTDLLYFLSGTNLVTVDPILNTASHMDIYPSFGMADFVRFFGLEFSESLGLIAIMYESNLNSHYVVQINPLNGNYTSLLTIPENVNSEFYATTYRECDKTYYLTTLNQAANSTETLYFEFDLNTNTVENSQIFQDYAFGIELIPQEAP